MTGTENHLHVRKIERGIVIDHLPAGSALKTLGVLGIDGTYPGTISIMVNAPSSRYGLKDMIKLEGKELSKQELDRASIAAPYATVNIIRDYAVVEKFRLKVPNELIGIARCPNDKCISRREGTSRFVVESHEPLRCRCAYCEKVYTAAELNLPENKTLASFG